jgi:hypothetical protein
MRHIARLSRLYLCLLASNPPCCFCSSSRTTKSKPRTRPRPSEVVLDCNLLIIRVLADF